MAKLIYLLTTIVLIELFHLLTIFSIVSPAIIFHFANYITYAILCKGEYLITIGANS